MKNEPLLPQDEEESQADFCNRCVLWCLVLAVLAALGLIAAQAAPAPMRELALCYDRARWDEATHVSRRRGVVVLNVNDGRGSDTAEARAWDVFAAALRATGGTTLGYVDFLDSKGRRKLNAHVITESLAWISAGYNGVWLDDARDNGADADVIRGVMSAKSNVMVIANPGATVKVKGPLKRTGVLLCESESLTPNYESRVVIAFNGSGRDHVESIRGRAALSGVALLAIEPSETYHVAGVEYQKPNPFIKP